MSIVQRIGQAVLSVETNQKANEFLQVARALLATRSNREAGQFLARLPASARTLEAFQQRAAVPVGTLVDSTWAAPLGLYQQVSDAFAETLRSNSAFDRVLADGGFLRVPPQSRVVIVTAGGTAYQVGEGAPKPATQLSLSAAELAMIKVAAYVVTSAELMHVGSTGALALLGRELRGALGVVTDTYFIAQLVTGLTAIPSAGSGAVAIRNDIRFLLDAISFDSNARLYFITTPQIAKRLSSVGDSSGGRLFTGLTPTGGTLDGIPLLVSDSATAGTLTLADMSQVAAAAGVIELDRSDAASLAIDSAPDSPPIASSSYTNLWTQNLSALRAERFLSVQRLRTTAVAQVSGITGVGNSPS